ncbi:MAG: hypothetical protein IJB37_07015, partial [Peptococcaceae bacterium]|nr:hypothetical protein [Peptococcaceae bacterium]
WGCPTGVFYPHIAFQAVSPARQRPCLSLWERWLSIAKPERASLYPLSQKSKIFVSSPKGRAKGAFGGKLPEKWQFICLSGLKKFIL